MPFLNPFVLLPISGSSHLGVISRFSFLSRMCSTFMTFCMSDKFGLYPGHFKCLWNVMENLDSGFFFPLIITTNSVSWVAGPVSIQVFFFYLTESLSVCSVNVWFEEPLRGMGCQNLGFSFWLFSFHYSSTLFSSHNFSGFNFLVSHPRKIPTFPQVPYHLQHHITALGPREKATKMRNYFGKTPLL